MEQINFNPAEFIDELSKHSFDVTPDYVRKLYQRNLLPKPEVKSMGKGKGRRTEWTDEMLYQTVALLRLNHEQKVKVKDIKGIREVALKANGSPGMGYELLESTGYDEAYKNKMALMYILYMESARHQYTPDIPVNLRFELEKDKNGEYIREEGNIKVKSRIIEQREDVDINKVKELEKELKAIEEKYKHKGELEKELNELKATVS